jgi:hypothetical protein
MIVIIIIIHRFYASKEVARVRGLRSVARDRQLGKVRQSASPQVIDASYDMLAKTLFRNAHGIRNAFSTS